MFIYKIGLAVLKNFVIKFSLNLKLVLPIIILITINITACDANANTANNIDININFKSPFLINIFCLLASVCSHTHNRLENIIFLSNFNEKS